MIETMFSSLFAMLSSPHIMGLMLLAVLIGLVVGITPGIGGRLSIALAIPFVFGMEMIPGAVFLLTMHAVNGTCGQISSIMFGVPGDGDDAATTIDGYPMAKKGEAGRALGASVTASGFGGIIGAIVFAVMIPVLEPVVMAFSPAEFFLLALLGITFIAFLAGRDRIFKGLIVGLFGMMLATVGMDPYTGTPVSPATSCSCGTASASITAVLALFAIPEMIALAVKGGSISSVSAETAKYSYRQLFEGVLEVPRHWWLARAHLDYRRRGRHDPWPRLVGGSLVLLRPRGAILEDAGALRQGRGGRGDRAGDRQQRKEGGALLPTLFFGIPGKLRHGGDDGRVPDPRHPARPDHDHRPARSRLDADLGAGGRQPDRGDLPAVHHALGGAAHLRQWRDAGAVHRGDGRGRRLSSARASGRIWSCWWS